MATTQTVLIEFQADLSSLQSGIDTLEQMGLVDKAVADQFKKTNTEIKKQGDVLDQTSRKSQLSIASFSKLSDLMKQYPKTGLQRFLLQIGNELAAAGLKADDFKKKIDPKDTTPKIVTLRQELKLLKDQMQAAAVSGGVLGEEYLRLKKRAGELDDTIRDVANDIKNAGSDTRGIDNVVGSISALAGGFSAVQGAAALFGNESEDLQKALLRVNAAMALATGLQQVSNALTKQGSLTRLADAAATGFQVAAQKIYDVTLKGSIISLKAFKIALAATGIGLVIIGILALAEALKATTSDLEEATDAIDDQNRALESSNALLQRQLSIQLALSEQAGKAESDRLRIQGRSLQAQFANIERSNESLAEQRDGLKSTSEAWFKLNEQIEKNNETLRDLGTQVIVTKINLEKQLADEQKAAADKNKELGEKALAESKKRRAAEFDDFKAGVELKLLATEQGSREELELRKKLAQAQLLIDLEGENVTANQRKLLIQQFFKEKLELEKKFNKEVIAQSLADEKNRLSAELENLNLGEEEKLEVKIAFLQIVAAKEIEEADKNAAKIKAINAKLNADIAVAKVESIKKIASDELALSGATGGIARRALDRVAQDERMKADIRINAIRSLAGIETAAIDRQIKANRDASRVIGADQRALEIEYEQLLDKKAEATEAAEKKITDITISEQKKRRDNDIAYTQATIAGLQQIGEILASMQESEQQSTQNRIDLARRQLDDLVKAGAINEREAERRNKKIEAEERAAKQRAAQQQKSIAVFQALLAIPQAFIAGLTAPFPVGGPVYAAILAGLAAAQAATIASRPIPKFASGKKGSYRGVGEVGEIGAELIQRGDGRMEVATRRQLVYLGSQDKVFTAAETKRMLPGVNHEVMRTAGVVQFDYNKLAKAVSNKGNSTTVNIDKEFISESVASGLSRVNYFDRYYNSKG